MLYTLVIVALAFVQASQIHHNLTFPAAGQVSDCSGHHLNFRNRSLTRDLPTLTYGNSMSFWLELCYYGKPFTLRH
ncbi:hypothetical protein KR084_011180 [Drosophila pseudotakahashii]|nr:hypothetical protein KR084_011180 [Drosophila pseudotakahashii]